MSDIKYAYLKGATWLYRRNYPRDVAPFLGARALKQSLKTGDFKIARTRAAEVNAKYDDLVRKVRSGAEEVLVTRRPPVGWVTPSKPALDALRDALETSGAVAFPGKVQTCRRSGSCPGRISTSAVTSFGGAGSSRCATRWVCSPRSTGSGGSGRWAATTVGSFWV